MRHRGPFIIAACVAISLTGAVRSALAAGTCSFDPVAGLVTVEMTGPTTLRPQASAHAPPPRRPDDLAGRRVAA